MDSSILNDVKKIIGIDSTDTSFDTDIIMHLNTVIFGLYQMGIGTANFTVTDSTDKWEDFLSSTEQNVTPIKTYVALKVRSIFDPPTSGTAKEALEKAIDEAQFRLFITTNYVGEIS